MKLSRLYAVTDRRFIKNTLSEDVEAAIKGGVGMIQLREKNISDEEYIRIAKSIKSVCEKYNVPLIINDNIAVCLKSGADGVHLGQTDGSPKYARKILGDGAIIGVTAKTKEQIERAITDGADYIGSGAVFGTSTKEDAKRMDLQTFKSLTEISSIPVYAIGGINKYNIDKLYKCGAYGVAVVSGVFSGDITKNAQDLRKAVDKF